MRCTGCTGLLVDYQWATRHRWLECKTQLVLGLPATTLHLETFSSHPSWVPALFFQEVYVEVSRRQYVPWGCWSPLLLINAEPPLPSTPSETRDWTQSGKLSWTLTQPISHLCLNPSWRQACSWACACICHQRPLALPTLSLLTSLFLTCRSICPHYQCLRLVFIIQSI